MGGSLRVEVVAVVVVHRFSIALFSAVEQTHCARGPERFSYGEERGGGNHRKWGGGGLITCGETQRGFFWGGRRGGLIKCRSVQRGFFNLLKKGGVRLG